MKKLTTTLLGLALLSPFALAQEFTIALFPSSVNQNDGTTLLHSAGFNAFYAVGTQDAAGYASDFGTSSTVTADAFTALGGLSWVSLDELNAGGSSDYWTNPGWNGSSGTKVSAAGGSTILVALTDAASVGSSVGMSEFGLIATSGTVPGLGSINFQLGGSPSLGFTTIAGSGSGSLTLNAVPEPSAYALLGGLLALGCVMLRRRA